MKIAITSRGPSPDSPVDERFGRAYWLLTFDDETQTWDAFDNAEARNAVQGAGIAAAQAASDRGVRVVLTGVTGPKAFRALEAAGIEVYHGASGTAEAALVDWRERRLERATIASAAGRP